MVRKQTKRLEEGKTYINKKTGLAITVQTDLGKVKSIGPGNPNMYMVYLVEKFRTNCITIKNPDDWIEYDLAI